MSTVNTCFLRHRPDYSPQLAIASDPNAQRNCDQTQLDIPYRHGFKLAGNYPLPLGLMVGMSAVSLPGSLIGSAIADQSLFTNWNVPDSLFPGGRTQTVNLRLDVPGSQWLERWNQLDLNLRRMFRVGRVGFEPGVDVYNVFNTNPVLTENQQFGSSLGTPHEDPPGTSDAAHDPNQLLIWNEGCQSR